MKFYIPIKFDDIKIGDGLLVHFVVKHKDLCLLVGLNGGDRHNNNLLFLFKDRLFRWNDDAILLYGSLKKVE